MQTSTFKLKFQLTAARRRLAPGNLSWRLRQGTFQLTAARRRLAMASIKKSQTVLKFQLTAARRRLAVYSIQHTVSTKFQLTAARRRLGKFPVNPFAHLAVSTHSRPEAAGYSGCSHGCLAHGFNSQPPGGGWLLQGKQTSLGRLFQLTAARRRLDLQTAYNVARYKFQLTAARRRLAIKRWGRGGITMVSTHSRPEAAGSPGGA